MPALKRIRIGVIFCLLITGHLPQARAQHQLGEASKWPTNFITVPASPKPKFQTYTGAFVVNTDSREEVREFYNAIYPTSENVPLDSTADVANCYPGTNSTTFQQSVLRRINWFRAMAGDPANIVFNDLYNSNAQAVAVMISSSGLLNHNPPPDWPCYSAAGAAGAGGNQAGGFNGADAITGYIWDFGDGNSEVGHRRWILFPEEQIMGTGDIAATNNDIAGNSTYVFDSSINDPRPVTRRPYVSWPPEGFVPYQITFPYWSFALSNADFTSATIAMTSNGIPIATAIQTYQTGYGENTLVWIPMGLDANCECTSFPFSGTDTVYNVTVSNIQVNGSGVNFTYQVTVFDPAVPGTDFVPTTVNGPAQAVAGVANAYACTPLANTNTTGYLWLTSQLVTGGFTEDLANELTSGTLTNFTALSDPQYPLVVEANDGSGACLHFVIDEFDTEPQIVQCNQVLFPGTNTVFSFSSDLGYAFTNEVARVQVSTDSGADWQDLFAEPGCNPVDTQNFDYCESTFTPHSYSLSNYAGQPVLLRFNYDFLSPYEYFTGNDPYLGWCVENITLTNCQEVINQVTNATTSTNFTFTPAPAGNYFLRAAPVIFSQFPLSFGPVKQVSAIVNTTPFILMNQPVLTNNQVQLNFTVNNLTNATFHLLQTAQLNNPSWTTNSTSAFTTNLPNSSYRFTTTNSSQSQFYRVQTP